MKQRIWELDVFRGICIIGMVIVHLFYDLIEMYNLVSWDYPPVIALAMEWGGVLFVLLSGICATLGCHSVRRGLVVLGAGMLVSAVTYGMFRLGYAGRIIIIYFGVLHCLGCCMLLWWLFKRLPTWMLAILGTAFVVLGFYLDGQPRVDVYYLMPFGLPWKSFSTSDYFPLFPNLGWFLLGSTLGRIFYRKKTTLIPAVDPKNPLVRFFSFCGKQSLLIYLLHQPILAGICMLLAMKQ